MWRKLTVMMTALCIGSVSYADSAPKIDFEKYTLDNGLEVILHQDKRVPIVSVSVWYHVGSGNEVPGRSGFAHLFEHMLFQGSKHVGEDKHFSTLKKIGATGVNGTTNTDRTNYFEVVPSNQIETALWLESDRMGYLLPMITEKSFKNQVDVVRNERRQRIDNVPYGPSWLKMAEMLYPKNHPYKYSVIGRHEDLEAATVTDVVNFYKRWYVPANATLTISGDFETAEAKKLVAKWFGKFPKSQKPKAIAPKIPDIKAQSAVIPDKFAKLTQVEYAWHTPGFFQPGDAEFDILSHALGARGTGRLYQRLVLNEQLAQRVSVRQGSQQLSSTFNISVQLKPNARVETVKKIIDEELAKILKEGITSAEFKRALVQIEAQYIWGLEGLMARGELLQRYNHYKGDPGFIGGDLARYKNTSAAKVIEYGKKYLVPGKRVTLVTVPAKGGK